MPARVFLSYASEDRNIAEQIAIALSTDGARVFFDNESLPAGGDFYEKIRKEIKRSNAFVFIVSPDSVAPGSYTLTELKEVRSRWSHPKGRVFPVMVRKTDFATIPNYLKAVTIIEPQGSIAAETRSAMEHILTRSDIANWIDQLGSIPKGIASVLLTISLATAGFVVANRSLTTQAPAQQGGASQSNAAKTYNNELVFSDDFSSNTLNDAWQPVSGKWSIENGVLNGVGSHYQDSDTREWAAITLTKSVPNDCSVSFRARFAGGSTAELMLHLSRAKYTRIYLYLVDQGVMIGDGKFLEKNGPGSLDNKELLDAIGGGETLAQTSYPLRDQTWYNIVATTRDNQYTIDIGGQRILEYTDKNRILNSNGTIGFLTNGRVHFDDLVVKRLPGTSGKL